MHSGGRARARILLVEDESMIAMLLEDTVEDLGYLVIGTASRVAGALALLRTTQVDAAVLDVNLAGETSYPVADALKSLGVPFIFVTGYGEGGVAPEYREWPVVQKPFTAERIEEALAQLQVS